MSRTDETQDEIRELYEKHPYPGTGVIPPARELANLFKLYIAENSISLTGLRILDVGVGSGHRLIELAKAFPDNSYTAIDYSEAALAHARQLFSSSGLHQVEFRQANLEEDLAKLGQFDVITCMGVLHHLRDPNLAWKNISQLCHADTIGFIYVYGKLGSTERIKRKNILNLLAPSDPDDEWLQMVQACSFDELPYGWRDLGDGLPLYLDAYRNPRERLYDLSALLELFRAGEGNWHAAAVHSWIASGRGWLVDAEATQSRLPIPTTTLKPLSDNSAIKQRFEALPIRQRLLLLEEIYRPEAYTVSFWGKTAFEGLPINERLARSAIVIGAE